MSSSVGVPSPLVCLTRTLAFGPAQLNNPGCSHLEILRLMTSAETHFPHEVTLTGSGGQDGEVSFEGATIQPTAENTELQHTKHPLGAEAMVTLLVHHCLKPAWMGVFVFLKSKSNLHFFRNQEHLSFPAPNQYRQCHLVLQCRILLNLRLKFLCLPIGKTKPASTPQWVFWE